MKIEAVTIMRNAREKILKDTAGMSWEEEREYLRTHGSFFNHFVQQVLNNGGSSGDSLLDSGVRPKAGKEEIA